MDLIFHYCDVCTRRISQAELESGKAVATEERRVCVACQKAGAPVESLVSLAEHAGASSGNAGPGAPAPLPIPKPESKSHIAPVHREAHRGSRPAQAGRRGQHAPQSGSGSKAENNTAMMWAIGGGVAVVILLGVMLLTSSNKPTSTSSKNTTTPPIGSSTSTSTSSTSTNPAPIPDFAPNNTTPVANPTPPALTTPEQAGGKEAAASKAFDALFQGVAPEDKDTRVARLKEFLEKYGDTVYGARARTTLTKLQSDTPLPLPPVAISGPGIEVPAGREILLQAKHARISGEMFIENKFGGSQVAGWKSPNDAAIWTVKLPASGTYQASILYSSNPNLTAGRLVVDGGSPSLSWNMTPTKDWDDFAEVNLGQISLIAGENTLKFYGRGMDGKRYLMNLRTVRLTPLSTQSTGRELELTAGTAKVNGTLLAVAELNGVTRAHSWNTPSEFLDWNLTVKEAGKYKGECTYALGDNAPTHKALLSVGNIQLPFSFNTTGAWENYKTIDIGTIDLAAGTFPATLKPDPSCPPGGLMHLAKIRLIPQFDVSVAPVAPVVDGSKFEYLSKWQANQLAGGRDFQNWNGTGKNARAIWGQKSDTTTFTMQFDLPAANYGAGALVLNSQPQTSPTPCLIAITLNGKEIFNGRDPTPKGGFTDQSFPFPSAILKGGKNDLKIENREPNGGMGGEPWLMLQYVELRGEKLPETAVATANVPTPPVHPAQTETTPAAALTPLDEARRTVAFAQTLDTLKESTQLAAKSRFEDATALIKQKMREMKSKESVDFLRQEQTDVEALSGWRDRIVNNLRERKGQKIKLEKSEGLISDKQPSGQLGLQVNMPGGGTVDVNVPLSAITLKEIMEYSTPAKTAEEFRLAALWELLQSNETRGLELLRKAADAGLSTDVADQFRMRYMALRMDPSWKLWRQGDEQLAESNFVDALTTYKSLEKGLISSPFKSMLGPKLEKRITYVALATPGLEAVYYNDGNFEKEVLRRAESRIWADFNGGGTPDKAVRRSDVTVRWQGFVKVPRAGPYEFVIDHDDGIRLYINDKPVIDAWNTCQSQRVVVDLTEKPVSFKLEFQNTIGDGFIHVRWRIPNDNQDTDIPPQFLSHLAKPAKP